jgi:glycosyltransferase involved in cell wall biosynthesis
VKIVYVCTLEAGGPVTHLLDLAPRVARLGPDVHVVCATDRLAEEFRARGVDATVVPLRNKFDVRGAARIRPTLRGANIVHTHDRRTGLLVRPLARLHGSAVVHTLHGIPNEIFGLVGQQDARRPDELSRTRSIWLRQGVLGTEAALARLGTTIVPSEALRRVLLRHRFPEFRTIVIPNGVELRRSEPPERHCPLRLATAGKLERWKGIDLLLEACMMVRARVHLDVYGDGSLRSSLERQAARHDIHATFHGWVANVAERLAEADLFVLPSRADNLPIAVLEAMSVAVPSVATRIGGLPELVVHGDTGLLVEPEDVNGLAAAIDRMADDEPLRLRLGRAAAARLAARFETAVVAREIVALYGRLVRES